ncbi:hypothetical protein DY000_02031597 [Brassica cretica]|uniref:H(+)-exporting diphosphatase n=1 Tax=Brassica cretica TaxID=69181 RepID=A0ABQ7DPH5_BRACR|nr:hypothetical protein DY000_02031597 [Brassica cretica]
MGGFGIAGALTSGLRLITKAIFDKSSNGLRKGALLSIRIATLIKLGCLILYVTVFAKLPIVKYYHSKAWKEGAKSVAGDLASVTSKSKLNRIKPNVVKLTKFEQDIKLPLRLCLVIECKP